MDTVEIKKSGFWYGVYLMLYLGKNLPKDTCTYRKRLIFALVFSILVFPITILRLFSRGVAILIDDYDFDSMLDDTRGLKGALVTFVFLVIPIGIGSGLAELTLSLKSATLMSILLSWVYGVIILLICVSLIVGSVFLLSWMTEIIGSIYYNIINDRKLGKDRLEAELMAKELPLSEKTGMSKVWAGWKDRFCNKIIWKD